VAAAFDTPSELKIGSPDPLGARVGESEPYGFVVAFSARESELDKGFPNPSDDVHDLHRTALSSFSVRHTWQSMVFDSNRQS
jgi:hypothetical protein